MDKLDSFADFWPVYLRAHSNPTCRALHYAASITGIAGFLLAVTGGNLWWILVGMVGAYALAWVGHFFVEENVPLTFTHPLWSLRADYWMFILWLTGRLGVHLRAAGVDPRGGTISAA